ncbi:MAG: hypothetical protein HY692_09400 [Cyanobacteria bacterium NC_groundwater_1444_Ag_S-0.65um_54_12]|nr:hypothetical protein [Cyanobacteria bacterium NC_groundwater_1444_Ag_S-0.65um_54_12]
MRICVLALAGSVWLTACEGVFPFKGLTPAPAGETPSKVETMVPTVGNDSSAKVGTLPQSAENSAERRVVPVKDNSAAAKTTKSGVRPSPSPSPKPPVQKATPKPKATGKASPTPSSQDSEKGKTTIAVPDIGGYTMVNGKKVPYGNQE